MPLPLPDKKTMCHYTGFSKSCFECVTEHGCRKWKPVSVIVDRHPDTGEAIAKDIYDCLDSIEELFWKDMLRRQLQTTATVDKLSNEVKQANDGGMANALLGINREIRRQTDMLEHSNVAALPDAAPKLIENN